MFLYANTVYVLGSNFYEAPDCCVYRKINFCFFFFDFFGQSTERREKSRFLFVNLKTEYVEYDIYPIIYLDPLNDTSLSNEYSFAFITLRNPSFKKLTTVATQDRISVNSVPAPTLK